MPHYCLRLSYDGGPYHGWQVQPGLATVQGVLAEAIAEVVGEFVLPQGSGRTDAGVHALGQVASFSLTASVPAPNLHRALNRVLPAGIRVLACTPAAESFHARHSARGKVYEYRIFERRRPDPSFAATRNIDRICPPFDAPYVWDCRWPLDLHAMRTAASALLGTHDFRSFGAVDPDLGLRLEGNEDNTSAPSAPNPVKTIRSVDWTRSPDRLTFRIEGSGFLHHMVRNIVGTLVEVGRGAIDAAQIPRILAAHDRSAAGPTAPPHGLFLTEVLYPGTEQSSHTDLVAGPVEALP